MCSMNASLGTHAVTYIITIQSEHRPSGSPVFRGKLETIAGQRFEFDTIAEFNSLLYEICGWTDPAPSADEEPQSERKEVAARS
jgi:hypothetical protein